MAIRLSQSIHLFALKTLDADCSRWSTSQVVDFSNVVVSMQPSHLWLDMVNPLGVCNLAGGWACDVKFFVLHSTEGPLPPNFPQVCPTMYLRPGNLFQKLIGHLQT